MDKDKLLLEKLIIEANEMGFKVENFNELVAMKRKIKNFVPVLLKYLFMFEKDNYKEAIIRILGVKGFYQATEILLDLYFNDVPLDKWAIGDALYSIQDKRFEEKYIDIVRDRENGRSRQMVVLLLGKLKCEKAIPTLISLLKDNEVAGHAVIALGNFKKVELIEYIEPFLRNEKTWIRKEAEKAIGKIKK